MLKSGSSADGELLGQLKSIRSQSMTCWKKTKSWKQGAPSEQGKMKDRMERATLESELHNLRNFVDRILPEVLAQGETAAVHSKGKVIDIEKFSRPSALYLLKTEYGYY